MRPKNSSDSGFEHAGADHGRHDDLGRLHRAATTLLGRKSVEHQADIWMTGIQIEMPDVVDLTQLHKAGHVLWGVEAIGCAKGLNTLDAGLATALTGDAVWNPAPIAMIHESSLSHVDIDVARLGYLRWLLHNEPSFARDSRVT